MSTIKRLDEVLQPVSLDQISAVVLTERICIKHDDIVRFSAEQKLTYTRAVRLLASFSIIKKETKRAVLEVGADDNCFQRLVNDQCEYFMCDKNIQVSTKHQKASFKHYEKSGAFFDFIYCGHTIEHMRGSEDKEFIKFIKGALKPGGDAVIEPIFIQEKSVHMWSEIEDAIADERACETQVVDKSSNFPGSSENGMGFGRILSIADLETRFLDELGETIQPTLYEFHDENGPLPNISHNKYKREKLNCPLRVLHLKRD